MSSDCLFCKIVKGEIPSDKVFENDLVYAFRDINPRSPQHVLIISKKHFTCINDFEESDKEILGEMLYTVKVVAKQLGFADNGYRTVINTGEDGGQEVGHIHIHVLGGRKHTWPPG